jgi:transposase
MLVSLREEMSISAIARFYGINWKTIKNCEKEHLGKKYKKKKLKNVKIIGIDEIYISPKRREYITIVRDLKSGEVLHVGKGKGVNALKDFTKRLRCSKAKIKTIAMDMSGPFKSWAKDVLPKADIVFDHFHVIKLMNDKVNTVRISTMKELDDEQKQHLTGQKFLLLKGEEKLKIDKLIKLNFLRDIFKDLGEVSLMKEYLRGIYKNVKDSITAESELVAWCELAIQTSVKGLHQMAKTIQTHMKGIVAFWSSDGVTNASMEGFNCKVRCLIKQAYGYRDMEYFYLKIYDLPKRKIKQVI